MSCMWKGEQIMKPKLSSTVSVVKLSNSVLEFFKSNIREQVRIRIQDDTILKIVQSLDGKKSIDEIAQTFDVELSSLQSLFDFLDKKGILDHCEPKTDIENYEKYRRVIHFLLDYSVSHEHLVSMWNKLKNSHVLIVGLGAVGSWVACNLAQSGVNNLILMDSDTVEISNLHRQFGYTEKSVGQLKTAIMEQRLKKYNSNINILKVNEFLDANNLSQFDNTPIDLVINCADKPNVDTTSLWIGEYCMKHNIPHIVGGGYNLHLSLIGQTVLPGKSACVKCIEKQLTEMNCIDTSKVKKLAVKGRKVGSFGPMCSLIASFVGMEAVKVLSGCTLPANINRRGEFNIYTMDISYTDFIRRDDCEWCGKKGIYYNK